MSFGMPAEHDRLTLVAQARSLEVLCDDLAVAMIGRIELKS